MLLRFQKAAAQGNYETGNQAFSMRLRFFTTREISLSESAVLGHYKVQNRRKPARCQATTVSGRTMASAERQSRQTRDRKTHSMRSPAVNFGRFLADRLSTAIWWRRARFSSSRAARERKIEPRVLRSVVREMSIGGKNYE